MGMLNDLVRALARSAEAILQAMVPSQEFDGIAIKGIDSVKIGTLHAILSGKAFEEILPEYDEVASGGDEGPWVFELPDELTNRLASLSAADRLEVGSQWARTEEFMRYRGTRGASYRVRPPYVPVDELVAGARPGSRFPRALRSNAAGKAGTPAREARRMRGTERPLRGASRASPCAKRRRSQRNDERPPEAGVRSGAEGSRTPDL